MLKHICNYPGCNNLVDIGQPYCKIHAEYKSNRQQEYDRSVRLTRDAKYHGFYVSPEWEQMKRYINSKYKGLCVWSYYHGSIEPAAEIHHIEPLRTAWDKRLNVDNLIPLTHTAHMMVEAKYRKGNVAAKQELFELLEQWKREFSLRGG